MNSKSLILVYVEDVENSILVMKMVVERVMKLPALHVLHSRTDFVQQVKGSVLCRTSFFWTFK